MKNVKNSAARRNVTVLTYQVPGKYLQGFSVKRVTQETNSYMLLQYFDLPGIHVPGILYQVRTIARRRTLIASRSGTTDMMLFIVYEVVTASIS